MWYTALSLFVSPPPFMTRLRNRRNKSLHISDIFISINWKDSNLVTKVPKIPEIGKMSGDQTVAVWDTT